MIIFVNVWQCELIKYQSGTFWLTGRDKALKIGTVLAKTGCVVSLRDFKIVDHEIPAIIVRINIRIHFIICALHISDGLVKREN